jgi:hypothetical protein
VIDDFFPYQRWVDCARPSGLVRSVTYWPGTRTWTCWRSEPEPECHMASDMVSRSDVARSYAAEALPFKILLLAWRHTQLKERKIAYTMVSRPGGRGEDRLTPVRRMSIFLQELLHVQDILESIQKLTHALRPGQGMEHVRCNQVQVLELYRFHDALLQIICKGQIHLCRSREGFLQKQGRISHARVPILKKCNNHLTKNSQQSNLCRMLASPHNRVFFGFVVRFRLKNYWVIAQ